MVVSVVSVGLTISTWMKVATAALAAAAAAAQIIWVQVAAAAIPVEVAARSSQGTPPRMMGG
tara:strand:- start:90 stop:275 length:186 start_codon:yes stop_codon:yes gene_type:complete